MRRLYIVLSYPLSEPVVRNRFMPWLQSCLAVETGDFEVTLVSPPNSPEAAIELPSGVRHIAVDCAQVQGVPFLRRAWREWRNTQCLYRALESILRKDAHSSAPVVMVSVPSMFLLFLLPKAAQLEKCMGSATSAGTGLTLALDIRDLTWEYLPTKGLMGLIKRILQKRAAQQIRQPHWVSTSNQQELAYVRRLRDAQQPDTCLWVTNGISSSQFEILRNLPSARAFTENEKRTQVLYLGNIGLAEHLSSLIEAAALHPQMDFTLVGSGGDAQRLRNMVKEQGLTNVQLPGRCRWEEVQSYYQNADILFAQVHPDHQQQMPSKLYEYLATGRPLVFAGNGYALQVLKDFAGVYSCQPLSAVAISDALEQAQVHLNQHTDTQLNESRIQNLQRLEQYYIRERAIEQWLERVL